MVRTIIYKRKAEVKKGPAPKPTQPPTFPSKPSMPPPAGLPARPGPRPPRPVFKQPARKPAQKKTAAEDKEFEETLKKLKEMSK